jgi:hypothetical protein
MLMPVARRAVNPRGATLFLDESLCLTLGSILGAAGMVLRARLLLPMLLCMALCSCDEPEGRSASTQQGLAVLLKNMVEYHHDHGTYPENLDRLRTWMFPDVNHPDEHAPLADEEARRRSTLVRETFEDVWGHPFRYVPQNPRLNVGYFELYSIGKNGIDDYDKPDFGDDIHALVDGATSYPGKRRKPGPPAWLEDGGAALSATTAEEGGP